MKKITLPFRKRLIIYLVIIAIPIGLMIGDIFYAWAVPLGDFDGVKPYPKIQGVVNPIIPENQTEPHTCGFHAISAIYRSYGLEPKERRLRQRLGIDNQSIVYDTKSTGCLHPDIYRVVAQDCFSFQTLDLKNEESHLQLHRHLEGKFYALALIKRRENGHLHWVDIVGYDKESLRICDSMKSGVYDENEQDFWNKCLLSVILISPTNQPSKTALWRLHAQGVSDMYKAFKRE